MRHRSTSPESGARSRATRLSVAALAWLLVGGAQVRGDWPQHLGPERNGVAREAGLLERWPAGGPQEVWRVEGGVGMSGVAVAQGRAVTMVQRGGQQLVVALAADSGRQIWSTVIGPDYRNTMGDGPRSTPTIVGDRVYVYSGEGILLALELETGHVAWRLDTVGQLGGKSADYGMACSPLVLGDQVIVTVGAPAATVAAYDRQSGQQLWTAGRDHPAGYSSPALLDVGGRRQIVVFAGNAALGLDAGRILWQYPYETDFDCNIATPVAFAGKVFLSAGENHGCVLLALEAEDGSYAPRPVWSSHGPRSVMRNEWQTSIVLDGFLYGMDNVGGAGPITHLACVDAASGERRWQKTRFGKGNLIAADGKLLISTLEGELVLVRASPDQYEELGRAKVVDSTRQAPSLSEGLLYLRDDREIVCLDVRAR